MTTFRAVHMAFDEYVNYCTADEKRLLDSFFGDFSAHCLLNSREKALLQGDFERAILHYTDRGLPLHEGLALLEPARLGGFYARPSSLWFPLDDAAKIYPISMGRDRMAIFRLSVYLREDVAPALLQMALNFTIKRFPGFATTLKKGFFWHYLSATKRRFCVEKEKDIPCQPLKVSGSGSQPFRVLYYQNRISVELFHVLTDGTGGMAFLKVLAAEYLRLCGVDIPNHPALLDIAAPPMAEELENPFTRVPKKGVGSGFVNKSAVQMSGKPSPVKPCRILHFKMPTDQLKAAAKAQNATVTAYMLGQMFLSIRSATDVWQGEVSLQVPVNMRKFYPIPTVRNFSMYCGIRLPLEGTDRMEKLIPEISAQLTSKTDMATMTDMVCAASNLVRVLRFIPLAVKHPVAKTVYGFLGDKIFTTTLSNLGVVELPPEMAAHIESMDFVLGTGTTHPLLCAMVTVGDVTTFSVTKRTADPSFEERMYELLTADGIDVMAEGSELYGY